MNRNKLLYGILTLSLLVLAVYSPLNTTVTAKTYETPLVEFVTLNETVDFGSNLCFDFDENGKLLRMPCTSGGPGSESCEVDGSGGSCSVSCREGYYACCNKVLGDCICVDEDAPGEN